VSTPRRTQSREVAGPSGVDRVPLGDGVCIELEPVTIGKDPPRCIHSVDDDVDAFGTATRLDGMAAVGVY